MTLSVYVSVAGRVSSTVSLIDYMVWYNNILHQYFEFIPSFGVGGFTVYGALLGCLASQEKLT